MKNTAFLIFLFNMCLSTLQSEVGLASIQSKNPEPSTRAVNITVDPRIELLAVVQFLSDYDERYGLITRFDFPYKQDVRDYFSKHKNHAVVKLFNRMSAEGFSIAAPLAAMLYLPKPPELTAELPFTEYLNKRSTRLSSTFKKVSLKTDRSLPTKKHNLNERNKQ